MGMLDKSIAVVDSTTIDKIVSQNQSVTKIGGATAYAGITYSRHGIGTFVVSNIAKNDRQALFLRSECANMVQTVIVVIHRAAGMITSAIPVCPGKRG